MPLIITIDGGAGTGKTTVARKLAYRLNTLLLDTGALYRAVASIAQEKGIDIADEDALAEIAKNLDISFGPIKDEDVPQKVFLDGKDATEAIRSRNISPNASKVAALPNVREALLPIQRKLAENGCVAEGRDVGSVVLPTADYKFFFTASREKQAERRLKEYELKGLVPLPSLQEVIKEVNERDERDANRDIAPLIKPEGGIEIDTSNLDIEGVVEEVLKYIKA